MRGCDFQQSCLHTLSLKATALPAISGDPAFTAAFLGLSANPGALEYETVPSQTMRKATISTTKPLSATLW